MLHSRWVRVPMHWAGTAFFCGLLSVNAATLPVFRTSGRFLLDPCGDTVVIKGIEQPVNFADGIKEIAKTGANFVRILVPIQPHPYGEDPAKLDTYLALVKSLGMAADVSLYDTISKAPGSVYTRPEVVPILKKYEDILTLHAQGEGNQSTTDQWVTDADSAVRRIRSAGLRCPLFILSTSYGRDPYTVLRRGPEVIDHDPLHNVLLGVQLYWGYTGEKKPGWYINQYGMTDKAAIDTFASLDFPVIAGINNHDPYGDPWLDYETQLSQTEARKIGWFWWDWHNPYDGGGKYHLSTTGKYGDWGVAAAGGPDLDKLSVAGGSGGATYEAESFSSRRGEGQCWGKIDHSSVSGGSFLCCSGSLGDWVEWSGVDGGSGGGSRTITFTYSNGEQYAKRVKVLLNGDSVGVLQFGNSGPGANDQNFWRVWNTESLPVSLRAGSNTLRLVTIATAGVFSPDYGYRTIVSHPASIRNTSRRTRYMLHHDCGSTPVLAAVAQRRVSTARGSLPGPRSFTIVNATGRTVRSAISADLRSARAMVTTLPRGVYLVETEAPDGTVERARILR